ncbi:hypothetical protein G6F57_016179 [Rhizopus arrhizus]|nr:hypothetical protein G6F57_016179 [Rhizopus arrhizus]
MRPWRAASYRAGVSSCGAIASSGAVSAAAANIGSCSWLVAFNAPVRNDTSGAGATRCSSRCSSGATTTTARAAGRRAGSQPGRDLRTAIKPGDVDIAFAAPCPAVCCRQIHARRAQTGQTAQYLGATIREGAVPGGTRFHGRPLGRFRPARRLARPARQFGRQPRARRLALAIPACRHPQPPQLDRRALPGQPQRGCEGWRRREQGLR